MLFEWDANKAQANKKKHKVSFELAQRVFDDEQQLNDFDRTKGDEDRYVSLGLVDDVILFVSHCYRENENDETVIRIISARKATSKERDTYDSRTSRRT